MRCSRNVALAVALLAGCESKISSRIDAELERRVQTFQDCFPDLYQHTEALIDIANLWRLRNSVPITIPPGMSASIGTEVGGTVVTVAYPVDGTLVTMTIRFYSPSGDQQTVGLDGGAVNLDTIIETAATELRANFPSGSPFLVGDYTYSGGGVTGNGSLTGLLGSGADLKLEELRTTANHTTISGGPPATDSATIVDSGPPLCTLTFTIPGLRTDESPTQQYPIGTIVASVTGPRATVVATLTFDGSATAIIVVDEVPGSFTFDAETRVLTFVP